MLVVICCAQGVPYAGADPVRTPRDQQQNQDEVDPDSLSPQERQQEVLATQLKLAELLEAMDDLAGALRIWTELLAGDAQNGRYLKQALRLAMELSRHRMAAGLGRRLLRLQPEDQLARARLARALVELGHHAEALVHLRRVAGKAPRDPQIRRQLARTLEITGRHAEALTHCVWLGAAGHAVLEDHQARIRLHGKLNQPQNQRMMLRWLLSRVAGRAEEHEVRRELAYSLEASAEHAAALEQFHWLVGQAPRRLEYRLARLRLYVALKTRGRLRAELAAVLQLGPTVMQQRPVREGLAAAHELLEEPARALEHYNWLVARHPRSVEYRLGRAAAYADLERPGRQYDELVALVRFAPRDPRVQRALGEVHYHQERYALAERHFRTVLRLLPGDGVSLRRLAQMRRARELARLQRLMDARARERLADWNNDAEERAEDF